MANATTLTPPEPDTAETDAPAVDETPEETPAPRFTIHDFQPAEPDTIYDDAVQALINAQTTENENPTGPNGQPRVKSITVLVPSDKKGHGKHLREFRASAAKFDRTARIRHESAQDDGTTAIEFTLTPKVTHKPRAGKEESESSDTPTIS